MLFALINDVELLTIALSMSGLKQVAETIMMSDQDSYPYAAAHRALDIGWKPEFRESMAQAGCFSKGLVGLIELSKQNQILATRLMPVFSEMIYNDNDLGISEDLKCEAELYMNSIFERDGYAIKFIDNDGYVEIKLNDSKLEQMALEAED